MTTTRFHRILVVANETSEGRTLHTTIRARAPDPGAVRVLLVAPALNSRLRHWLSDEDEARRAAEERLRRSLDRLDEAEICAEGVVGDADPLQAIDDALRVFHADEIVIATHPEGRSNWLARGFVERARRRYAQPIIHVVVDTTRDVERVAA
jgi:universal stress protein family protein